MAIDVATLRRQFPILTEAVNGHPLTYLDNAATTQKPDVMLRAMHDFYVTENANVHRGMHALAERATVAYENARAAVQSFLNAQHPDEIVFTKSATEGINLVARSWGAQHLQEGDVVLLTILEHHSNVVPWLQLKEEKGIDVQWIDIDDTGVLQMDMLDRFLAEHRVKLICVTGQSNVLGVRPDLQAIIERAHATGARVLVDAAQLSAHAAVDVQTLDCDFLVFSGHKVYGPTGIGVLYGKRELLASMPPFLGGGMMIHEVFRDHFTPADPPARFEAGTPPIAEAVGLGSALTWLQSFPAADREAHERSLLDHAAKQLAAVPHLRFLGPLHHSEVRSPLSEVQSHGCLSFILEGVHPHDLTHLLGEEGICLRAGHHCTQPLHRRLAISASTRLSVGLYNTMEEIDRVAPAIVEIQRKFHSSSYPHLSPVALEKGEPSPSRHGPLR